MNSYYDPPEQREIDGVAATVSVERANLFGFPIVRLNLEVESGDETGYIFEGEVCDADGCYLADLNVGNLTESEKAVKLTREEIEQAWERADEAMVDRYQAAMEDAAELRRDMERDS